MNGRTLTSVLAGIIAAISLGVLGAWSGWLTPIATIEPSAEFMKGNAAVGTLLASIALLLGQYRDLLRARRLAALMGCAVALIGGVTMAQLLPFASFNVDQALFLDDTSTSSPGRMGMNMAAGLVLIGGTLVWRSAMPVGRRFMPWAYDGIVLLAGLIAYLGLAGHANGTELLYAQRTTGTAMSVEAALALVLLATALLAQPAPSTRTFTWLRRPTTGGAMVRLMLPIAAVVPLIMGALVHELENGGRLHDSFASILLVEVPATLLIGAVLAFSLRLDRLERASTAELATARDSALAASRSKSMFLANMSHELRTPLNGVIGMTSLLAETDLDAAQLERVQTIMGSGQALLELVNDVLDISMIEEGRLHLASHDVDLRLELDRLIDLLAPAASVKGIALSSEVAEDVPAIVGADIVRLRQVVTNLLSNAVKFTDHGAIRVTVRVDDPVNEGPTFTISVADTGIGIPPDRVDDIFEPFTQIDLSSTRRHGGSGLGLAISRRLAEMMGGHIAVASEPGNGSTFSFTLPLLAGVADTGTATAPAIDVNRRADGPVRPARPTSSGTVLVAEDNIVNQQVVTSMLRQLGVPHVLAPDGEDAVRQWSTGRFALVLMDCQMPGVDGYQATQRIRRREDMSGQSRTPIIAMTAHAMNGDRQRCLDSGMDDYVSKPFDLATIEQLLERWYERDDDSAAGTGDDSVDDWDEFILELWLETADLHEQRIATIIGVIDELHRNQVVEDRVRAARAAAHDFAGTLANFGLPDAGKLARRLSPYLRRAGELTETELAELAEIGDGLSSQVKASIAAARAASRP